MNDEALCKHKRELLDISIGSLAVSCPFAWFTFAYCSDKEQTCVILGARCKKATIAHYVLSRAFSDYKTAGDGCWQPCCTDVIAVFFSSPSTMLKTAKLRSESMILAVA